MKPQNKNQKFSWIIHCDNSNFYVNIIIELLIHVFNFADIDESKTDMSDLVLTVQCD